MSSVNKVIIIGNLGADPEVRTTPGGQPVANLRVATNEVWNDKDGNRQERTEWHSVTVWGKQAEHCGQYLSKGRQVYVEGRLQSRTYQKDGADVRVWDVVASVVQFLGGDTGGQRPAQGQAQRGGQRPLGGGGGQRPAPSSGGGWGGGGGEWSGPKGGNGGWGDASGDDPIPF